jgi:hypothetical protein
MGQQTTRSITEMTDEEKYDMLQVERAVSSGRLQVQLFVDDDAEKQIEKVSGVDVRERVYCDPSLTLKKAPILGRIVGILSKTITGPPLQDPSDPVEITEEETEKCPNEPVGEDETEKCTTQAVGESPTKVVRKKSPSQYKIKSGVLDLMYNKSPCKSVIVAPLPKVTPRGTALSPCPIDPSVAKRPRQSQRQSMKSRKEKREKRNSKVLNGLMNGTDLKLLFEANENDGDPNEKLSE